MSRGVEFLCPDLNIIDTQEYSLYSKKNFLTLINLMSSLLIKACWIVFSILLNLIEHSVSKQGRT